MKTVPDLQLEISRLQEEIKCIQANCPHPDFQVMMFSWRPGAFHPNRICKTCDACLPGITEEESQKTWDDWNRPMNDLDFQGK